ncbi:PTS sugar transporter subunit IIA [candidate division WOR-3 bacterium]|nr:PTS sugar transporter subunit IIA [candidate division WOR-3 bacterium]
MICELLKPENIIISNDNLNFEQTLDSLVSVLALRSETKNLWKDFLLKREELISSRLGKGVMIFRAWPVQTDRVYFSLGIFPQGLEIETFDGEKIKIAGLLAAPKENESEYHENLVSVLRLFNENSLRDDLILSQEPSKILQLIKDEESELEKTV